MRVGVLTGGGDCPGLNAVIRAMQKDPFGIDPLEVKRHLRSAFRRLDVRDRSRALARLAQEGLFS